MTKVVLYNAISVDGFIAKLDGDSDWVDDSPLFEKLTKECGCVVLGRTTYEQFKGDVYPIEGVEHLVLTSEQHDLPDEDSVYFVNSVEQALQKADELGYDTAMVVGGSKTNRAFLESGAMTELWVDVHPLLLGRGLSILGGAELAHDLQLLKMEQYEGYVHMRYAVKPAPPVTVL